MRRRSRKCSEALKTSSWEKESGEVKAAAIKEAPRKNSRELRGLEPREFLWV